MEKGRRKKRETKKKREMNGKMKMNRPDGGKGEMKNKVLSRNEKGNGNERQQYKLKIKRDERLGEGRGRKWCTKLV